jgi:hypothetical protein
MRVLILLWTRRRISHIFKDLVFLTNLHTFVAVDRSSCIICSDILSILLTRVSLYTKEDYPKYLLIITLE